MEAGTYTWPQVYLLSVFALLLSLAAFIVGILAFQESHSSGNSATIVNSFENANGFVGTIDTNQLTLSTTIKNEILAANDGSLLKATADMITSKKLDGFTSNNPGNNIAASDSIVQALGKSLVLKSTPLINLTPTLIPITATDTIFDGMQKLTGCYPSLRPIFSTINSISTTGSIPVNFWGYSSPSPVFVVGSLASGSNVIIRIFGRITTDSSSGSGDTFTLRFAMNGVQITNQIINPIAILVGTRNMLVEIELVPTAALLTVTQTVYLCDFPGDASGLTWSNRLNNVVDHDPTVQYIPALNGLTSSSHTAITVTNTIATPMFNAPS